MKRILIVNVNWVGDVLFSTPAIRALRKNFPESHIACLVPLRCKDLLKNNPYLNEVIVCEDRHAVLSWFKLFRTARALRKKRFDTALFFHRSKTKVFLAWLAGIPERWGFWAPRRGYLLTRACPPPKAGLHRTDIFLHLLENLGIPPDGRTPDFFPEEGAGRQLQTLLKEHGVNDSPYIVVHAGGNWALKRWPAGHFAEWIRLFRGEFSWKVILCGTRGEEEVAGEITSHFAAGEVVSLCGKTSMDMLAVLLKNARLLLSNDSGPIHLAASQETRILGIFGPTSPEETGPISKGAAAVFRKDVGCEIPCYFRSCDTRVCMDWLTPQEVFGKAKELLERK